MQEWLDRVSTILVAFRTYAVARLDTL